MTSFDLNFREKLWNVWGGQQKAVEVIGRIVEHVDVLVGNEEDLQKGIGIEGQDVHAQSKLDPSAFFAMIDKVVAKHPNVKGVATTLREVHHTNHHTWGAVAWLDGKTYQSPTCQLNVIDRVGGGDGFAAGLHLRPAERRDSARSREPRLGARRLLTTFPGRHDHGDRRPSARFRQGRLGAHPALSSPEGGAAVARHAHQGGGDAVELDLHRLHLPTCLGFDAAG